MLNSTPIKQLLLFILLLLCFPVLAQKSDTTKVYNLKDVVVFGTDFSEVRSSSPSQNINSKDIEKINALQVSDVVKHFAGVTVKDYGGVGGLKTVSVRSLGSAHTTVSIDGVAISDCQTGQIDIGRFSLENVDAISLVNGQSDNIFQPAKLFSSAAILNIQTKSPIYTKDQKQHLKVGSNFGSFEFVNPSFFYDRKISNRFSFSFNADWMQTAGNYPFLLHYGQENDSTSNERRKNNDVKKLRLESSLFGHFAKRQELQIKSYYYQSEQGLPSAVILYNPNSFERMWDNNFFTQLIYKKEFSSYFAFQTNAKYNSSFFRYLDPDYLNADGKEENNYYQHEYYLSSSLLYRMLRHLSLALSSDIIYNDLDADLYNFSYPKRYSWLSVLSAKYVNESLLFTASVLSTSIKEDVKTGNAATDSQRFSPFVSCTIKPFEKHDFRLRFFYKNIFRMPSFNDLYYSRVGNVNLQPENANQYNAGITYLKKISNKIPYVSITSDAYYNQVTDKIVAIPTKNIFIWTMTNLGEVSIKGVDLTLETSYVMSKNLSFLLQGNYTCQRALDITDPTEKTYNNQIAYTPRISGSGYFGIETPWVELTYSLLFSGSRYVLGQNLPENRLNGYKDMGISIKKKFDYEKCHFTISAELLNILNKNYEIVKNYPMPGRYFRIGISLNY